jgi:poly [ADP-ribose] polymerase
VTDDEGVKWPIGKVQPTMIPQGSLLYNEFIVYDITQIKMRYLLRVKFNYKY